MRFSMRLFLTICCRSMWKSSQNSFWLLFIMVLKNKHVSKQRFWLLRTSLSTSSWGRFKRTRDNEVTQNLQTLSISDKLCKKKIWGQTFGNIFVSFRWVSLRKDQDKICLEYIYSVFKFLNFILFSVIITLKKFTFFALN